ncbi:hypothetical protein ACQ86N_41275 [Puia sp. P3]|uniref:hypothetical protein n=1 Tax=Puia sp. P3 TaxID=3423952 RepID=UPI003D67CEF0
MSGGQPGQDGVVITRDIRDTARVDPLLSVKEFDTVVFRVCKNGNVGVGTTSPQAQLHTTGTVRFAGLTSDTTQTRVLVSDASGNLFYRSASSLADNQLDPLITRGQRTDHRGAPDSHNQKLARLRIRQHLSAVTTD